MDDVTRHEDDKLLFTPPREEPWAGDTLTITRLLNPGLPESEIASRARKLATPNVTDSPLLDQLRDLAQQRDIAEENIRLLVLWALSLPDPYPLKTLAEATRLSISGVRTLAKEGDRDELLKRLHATSGGN